MDWPSKSLRSRIAWAGFALRIRWTRRRRAVAAPRTEVLHSLPRHGRRPLFVLVVTDRAGRLVHAAICDPEDY
jgi:hypothetical protein